MLAYMVKIIFSGHIPARSAKPFWIFLDKASDYVLKKTMSAN